MTDPLTLSTDRLQIEIWPLGARLNQATFDGVACLNGSATRDEALGAKQYHGAIVGPVANRLANGQAEIDGVGYQLPLNENDETTCHSGPEGVHALDWQVTAHDDASATLTLGLADGHGGLPGARRLSAHYAINGTELTITFEATSDAPTLMNLALHPYWTLGAGGRDGLEMKINAARYVVIDEKKIPTGEVADVAGTKFDLRKPGTPSTEIDHNYCLSDRSEPTVTLSDGTLRLEIDTDAPGLQIFTGKPLGIAIEPQHWPDAPHHHSFPSILLRPGETYRQSSTYRFSRL